MYTGTLIRDLCATVERVMDRSAPETVENRKKLPKPSENRADLCASVEFADKTA
jgi:hypothetical protein